MGDDVDEQEDCVDQVEHDEEPQGVIGCQAPAHERHQGDASGQDEHADRGAAEKPDGLCGPIFVELEADESIDQKTGAQRGGEAVLRCSKIRICARARRDDPGIQDQRRHGEKHVYVKECRDLFAT